MKCAPKTDSVNESTGSPEPRASTLITTFLHCSENDCMQIICKVHAVTNLWHSGVLGSRSSGHRFCETISPSSLRARTSTSQDKRLLTACGLGTSRIQDGLPLFSIRHGTDNSRLMLHCVHLAIIRPHSFCECRNYYLHHSY